MTYLALFFGTPLGCLIGRQYGFMEARRLSDTLKRFRTREEPREDVRLDWYADRLQRMGEG